MSQENSEHRKALEEGLTMKDRIILDLCGGTGAWSRPYDKAGYDVRNITLPGYDVRIYVPPNDVYGILAAPPCTHLAGSGARWWKKKGIQALFEGLAIVDACLRIIWRSNPEFWALENPTGRLTKYIGKPQFKFDPCDFGDPYTKKTYLWGIFNEPKKNPVKPKGANFIWTMPPGPDRTKRRSITPPGFSQAFFESNR